MSRESAYEFVKNCLDAGGQFAFQAYQKHWLMELTAMYVHKATDKLLASIFPERLPLNHLLQRCVTRTPLPDWQPIDVQEFPADFQGGFDMHCRECVHTDSVVIIWDDRPITMSEPGYFSVTVLPHFCWQWGICGEFRFWLPVTVWLGICERCGTVYWDRD